MGRYCCFPGCRTGYVSEVAKNKKNGRCNPSLFKRPKNPYYVELWERSLPIVNNKLNPGDHLCELHFKKEDVEKYYETKMPDGTMFRLERGRPLLKPTAVPCIFPNVPGHSSFVENKITKPKKIFAKPKKITQLSKTQKECKKAKISCPDNKTSKKNKDNETNKKNNSSFQPGKENVLMEVIVVQPVQQKSSTTQSSFLKERQNDENVTNYPISNSKQDAIPKSKLSATTCLDPVPDAIIENHSQQSICSEILTVSPSPDKLTQNYSELNNSVTTITESPMLVTPPENDSKLNNSIETVTESSMPDAIIEKYSNQNSPITITSPAPDTLPDNNSSHENDYDQTLSEFSSIKISSSNVDKNNCDKIEAESNISLEPVIEEEEVSFDYLKANVNIFETSNSWWRVNTFDEFIVFCRWTSYYTVERRVVITKDLDVKVFLIDKETAIRSAMKVLSLKDITKLIYRVENLKICPGTDKKDSNCSGFLESVFICKRYNLCLNCIKWRKEEKDRAIKLLKESANCIELLNFNLIT